MTNRILAAGLTLFFLTASSPVSAAENQHALFGFKAGLNLSRFYQNGEYSGISPDWKTATGYSFGFYTAIPFTSRLAVQPEVHLARKGSRMESLTFLLSCLEISALLRMSIPAKGNIKPYFLAGPYTAILVSAKAEGERNGQPIKENFKDGMNTADFGLAAAAGADWLVKNIRFTLELRYTFGLTDTNKTYFDDAEIYTSTRTLTIGFGF